MEVFWRDGLRLLSPYLFSQKHSILDVFQSLKYSPDKSYFQQINNLYGIFKTDPLWKCSPYELILTFLIPIQT